MISNRQFIYSKPQSLKIFVFLLKKNRQKMDLAAFALFKVLIL